MSYDELGREGWAASWAPANYGSDYTMTLSLMKDGKSIAQVEGSGSTPEQVMEDAVRKAKEWRQTNAGSAQPAD
jgi:hypothetical protein